MSGRRGQIAALSCGLLLASRLSAETLSLRDGSKVAGTLIRADAETVALKHCGGVEEYLRSELASISLDTAAAEGAQPACSSESLAASLRFPSGTRFVVRLKAPIDSLHEPVGQVFQAEMMSPVAQGARLLIREHAPVLLRLDSAKAGTSAPGLSLSLIAVRLAQGWADPRPIEENPSASATVSAELTAPADSADVRLAGDHVLVPASFTLIFMLHQATAMRLQGGSAKPPLYTGSAEK